MFWSDELAQKIINARPADNYWVDDMKTPSGRVHVGALRGVAIHALIQRSLQEAGKDAKFTYVFNDMDPMDGFPHYLPEEFRQHMGKPLYRIPSPEPGFDSLAQAYATEFTQVFNSFGFYPEIIWSSQRYQNGDFDAVIRQVLDNVDKIRHYYKSVSNYDKPQNWYPYQVICPGCGKVGTTIVTDWDGQEVTFTCQPDLVDWAEGCGHTGKITPTGDHGKLMWKVDWAAHWKVIGITVEGAGKDHMTEHGSHDLSSAISDNVLGYNTPFGFIYEWFLAKGGSKMSSSKGIGVSAKEISLTLPPEILRFMLVKVPYKRAITFDPNQNDSILQLFDEYDQLQPAFYQDQSSDEGRLWGMSQVENPPENPVFLPRFRDIVNFIQNPSVDIVEHFTKAKGSPLTLEDRAELDKRIGFANIWLSRYAPEKYSFQLIPQENIDTAILTDDQISYLAAAVSLLEKTYTDPQELQQALYQLSKDRNISAKAAFQAIYQVLLGKNHGPKAAWLILENLDEAKTRFSSLNQTMSAASTTSTIMHRPSDHIKLHPDFVKAYPSASVGYAHITGITVKSSDPELEAERQQFLSSIQGLTTEQLNTFVQLVSYRQMYKYMGIDWHSKRPSPEALLRRIATGKDMPSINTCVDAYNLVVMRHKISVGAFDAHHLQTPVELRVASGGESGFFIGSDQEEVVLKPGNVSYFDQVGPYNLYYNYRDAGRVGVTLDTTDIWINAEGVFEITPEEVQQTLDEAITIIQKYCGGQVVEKGMLLASQT